MNKYIIIIPVVLLCILVMSMAKKMSFKKKLGVIVASRKLLTENMLKIDGLELTFNNERIPDLQSTDIEISNTGFKQITSKDFLPNSSLRIITSGAFLICEKVDEFLISSSKGCKAYLKSMNSSCIEIHFESLKRENYVKLKLLHTGELSVEGTLFNGALEKVNDSSFSHYYFSRNTLVFLITFMLLMVISTYLPSSVYTFSLLILFTIFAIGIIWFWKKYKKYYKI